MDARIGFKGKSQLDNKLVKTYGIITNTSPLVTSASSICTLAEVRIVT